MKGMTRVKIWIVFAVVFALGTVTGAALGSFYRARAGGDSRREGDHGRDPKAHFEQMRRDLNLSDDQATRVSAVLEETRNEYRQLRTELRPRFEEPRLKARGRIRAMLDEAQRQKFDAITAQMDAKRDERKR